ncbi:LysR family transcriptional regulator [Vibrio sp. OCN044]|uniref:LysR family transcriptional regulator n=1 Tax=Vibrio tetraodonis subsp. pristinus TaxID=2695891 RepID=A0A6L8M0C6_9VIBR|nr:LysR family transcriptional regulator [Vibrio tetraodonis]MYM58902.1 LysR family transcriptional regulator [Vibrio tetraodonis subsp. pristinus]
MHSYTSIPVFIAVVESGSFSLAAKKLLITKSAVSKRITLLEEELGCRLLNRTTRKLSLTEAGQQYYDYASQSLALAEQGINTVIELQGKPRGKLKITVPMSFGVNHITPFLAEFMTKYPDLEVDMELEDKMVDLVQGGFDLGIRIGHLPTSNLVAKRLTICRSILCASKHYLEHYGEPQKPKDLSQHNCLRYAYFKGGQNWEFKSSVGVSSVLPQGNLTINNSEAIRRVLLDGLGIAQMPTFLISKDIVSGNLKPIMTTYSLPVHAVYVVYPERKHLPLKARVFIDFMVEKLCPDIPYWDQAIFDS